MFVILILLHEARFLVAYNLKVWRTPVPSCRVVVPVTLRWLLIFFFWPLKLTLSNCLIWKPCTDASSWQVRGGGRRWRASKHTQPQPGWPWVALTKLKQWGREEWGTFFVPENREDFCCKSFGVARRAKSKFKGIIMFVDLVGSSHRTECDGFCWVSYTDLDSKILSETIILFYMQ